MSGKKVSPRMIEVSIGIMAFNEAANIGRLLKRLLEQKTKKIKIKEIIVVVSGCTDATEEVVRKKIKEDRRIKLLVQRKRQGKAAAINLFIRRAKSPVLVMISADTLPRQETIERLVKPFERTEVGMTAGKVVPVNKAETFMGFYIISFWKLHHEIAKRGFKAGEMVAWRNVIRKIDPLTSTDETNIAALILKKGLKTVYVPGAVVYNRGPETLRDFFKVRRRHLAAYYHLREEVGLDYLPPTMEIGLVLKLFFQFLKPGNLKEACWLVGVIGLELAGKALAWWDWRVKGEHHPIWAMAKTTKELPANL